jgi:hypothetical protein
MELVVKAVCPVNEIGQRETADIGMRSHELAERDW